MEHGPIEFFYKECPIENPYFLYDPVDGQRYETFREAKNASESTFAYLGVEQLPAELPMDASEMFSNKLVEYIVPILKASHEAYKQGNRKLKVHVEIARATITNSEGQLTSDYSYLSKLL